MCEKDEIIHFELLRNQRKKINIISNKSVGNIPFLFRRNKYHFFFHKIYHSISKLRQRSQTSTLEERGREKFPSEMEISFTIDGIMYQTLDKRM